MKTTAQIFLCYAREDREKVENLYHRLSNAGFKPWMDKKDLVGGERWKSRIPQAIRDSDLFLACLSANSIDKRGWVQKEIKDALDIWREKLERDIYLIPVRLEDCEVLESLSDFQWVDLFEEDGWIQLVRAIQVGMERRAEGSEQRLATLYNKVAATAKRELERLAEKRRQGRLAALYAEAVRFLEAEEWQKALEKWIEMQAIDPAYPDPQQVASRAKRELTKPEAAVSPVKQVSLVKEEMVPIWRRVPARVWAAIGGAILLVTVIAGATFLSSRGGAPVPASVAARATTPVVTVAPQPVSPTAGSELPAIVSPTSTPVPATPTPTPTAAIAATQTALAAEVMATALAQASATVSASIPTPTDTPTQTPVPPTATTSDTPTLTSEPSSPTPTPTPEPSPPTPTLTPEPSPPTPTPTLEPPLPPTGSIALTIYLRRTETDFVTLNSDQPHGGMIYEERQTVYGDAAVQIGAMTYHFDKPLPDPWRVEFEFSEELIARTGGMEPGFDPTKAGFWVGVLDGGSAVDENNPYSLTMKLYEGNELRESIQVFFAVADAPDGDGDGDGSPEGKPPPPP